MNANTSLKLDEMRADLADRLDAQGKSNAGVSITLSDLSSKLINLLENGRLAEHEQRQLGSLVFGSMKEREEKIKAAYKKTLSWVFKNPDTAFMDWLQAQNGIYWVKGKVSRVVIASQTSLTYSGWKRQIHSHEVCVRS